MRTEILKFFLHFFKQKQKQGMSFEQEKHVGDTFAPGNARPELLHYLDHFYSHANKEHRPSAYAA